MCSNNLKLPIRAAPYRHQREAAAFALDRLAAGPRCSWKWARAKRSPPSPA